MHCWGRSDYGELGRGAPANSHLVPINATSILAGAVQLECGGYHACARLVSGRMMCWGQGLRLGYGSTSNVLAPTEGVPFLAPEARVLAFCLGSYHGCAVLQNATVACWGSNSASQAGFDSKLRTLLYPEVLPLRSGGVTNVSCGNSHTCALTVNGTVMCWGSNGYK